MKPQPYRDSYRLATLMAAICKKDHTYLFTQDSEGKNILKIYADKEMAQEVAVFRPDPKKQAIGKAGLLLSVWRLERQNKPVVTTTYVSEQQ